MRTDIFIKSYSKDFKWLNYCLQSIKKFIKGYESIIIIIPENERPLFNREVKTIGKTFVHAIKEEFSGYYWQQWIKLNAHAYSDADFIFYVDSDNIYNTPFNCHFTHEYKPEILMTKYERLQDSNAKMWQHATEKVLNAPVTHEFMRRFPFIYRTDSLQALNRHLPDIKSVISKCKTFSEFNLLGAFCHLFESDKYIFTDTDNWTYVEPILKQYWSYGGITPEIEAEIKKVIK